MIIERDSTPFPIVHPLPIVENGHFNQFRALFFLLCSRKGGSRKCNYNCGSRKGGKASHRLNLYSIISSQRLKSQVWGLGS